MLAGGATGVDIWTKQTEAGRGSRVERFLVLFFNDQGDLQLGKAKQYRGQALE